MADQQIKFNIGSTFSGEGFKQAQQSVGAMTGGIRSAASAASQLNGAFGSLESKSIKTVGAMTGLLNALVSLNATAILTQTAMIAISVFVGKCKDEIAALTDRTNKLKASMDKSFDRSLAKSVAEVNAEVKSISGGFERVAAQAAAFQSALMGLKGSVATGGIVNLEIEKVNKMLAAHSEAEKAQIEATYNLKIATEKAAASREQWNGKLEAAHTAVETSAQRVALYDDEIAAIQRKRAELEEARVQTAVADKGKADRIAAEIDKLMNEEARLRTAQNDAQAKVRTLIVQEQQVKQDAINADREASLAVTLAAAKIEDLQSAAAALAAKEQTAADTLQSETAAREAHARELEENQRLQAEARDAQSKVNESARSLADAERAYAAALAKYNANFEDNKFAESIFGGKSKRRTGEIIPVRVDGSIKAEVVAKSLEDAMKDGLITSVKDMDKFQRERSRQVDSAERERWGQAERERQRYEQLQETNRKSWSKADADFAHKFEQLRDAALAQKRELDESKARVEAEQRRAIENHENLATIAKKLEDLGLK